ncbi:hypothetical protein SDC9_148607 [bioreactor metagenome]|uniref:Uncharacterized protein n=1 Tax=bioreactor metagenome TaxID=1076179 RepID=A0A645EHB1_9ZZZZ
MVVGIAAGGDEARIGFQPALPQSLFPSFPAFDAVIDVVFRFQHRKPAMTALMEAADQFAFRRPVVGINHRKLFHAALLQITEPQRVLPAELPDGALVFLEKRETEDIADSVAEDLVKAFLQRRRVVDFHSVPAFRSGGQNAVQDRARRASRRRRMGEIADQRHGPAHPGAGFRGHFVAPVAEFFDRGVDPPPGRLRHPGRVGIGQIKRDQRTGYSDFPGKVIDGCSHDADSSLSYMCWIVPTY